MMTASDRCRQKLLIVLVLAATALIAWGLFGRFEHPQPPSAPYHQVSTG